MARARKRSAMSSEAGHYMCFYEKLGAYRQLLKSESLTADLFAGEAYVGHVFIQELPVGQEFFALVSVLPHRCYKVSIKVYQSNLISVIPADAQLRSLKQCC